jgi:hypothetical protein
VEASTRVTGGRRGRKDGGTDGAGGGKRCPAGGRGGRHRRRGQRRRPGHGHRRRPGKGPQLHPLDEEARVATTTARPTASVAGPATPVRPSLDMAPQGPGLVEVRCVGSCAPSFPFSSVSTVFFNLIGTLLSVAVV